MAVVAFDSLGTLLDLGELAESAAFRRALHHAVSLSLAGLWQPFGEIAAAVDPALPGRLSRLEPKPDARPALEAVREAGAEPWVLTNGGRDTTAELLERGGLASLVAELHTVEEVERYKPAAAVYELLPLDATLVAAHGWDIVGATAAGRRAVWVDREEGRWLMPGPEPELRSSDLLGAARLATRP